MTLYIGSVYRLHPPTQLLYMALQFSCMHEQTGSQACGGACILGLNKQAARPVVGACILGLNKQAARPVGGPAY